MMFLKITLAIILSTSNTQLIHSFTVPTTKIPTNIPIIALHNSVADEPYTVPTEDDNKVTGRKWGLSWGRDKIPILRRNNKSTKTKENIVQTVTTLEEYKEVVADEKDKLVVVRFFASWCKACQAIKPEYYRLSKQLQDENVKFVEVPLTKTNAFLHQGLGVPSIPYGHIYHPEAGLLEEQSVSKKNFKSFKAKLNSYIIGSCDLEDEEKYVTIDNNDVGTKLNAEAGAFE